MPRRVNYTVYQFKNKFLKTLPDRKIQKKIHAHFIVFGKDKKVQRRKSTIPYPSYNHSYPLSIFFCFFSFGIFT